MKKLFYIILAILILFIAIIIINKNFYNVSHIERLFKIKAADSVKINKIILTNNNKTIILEKQNSEWQLNNSFKADNQCITDFFNVLSKLELHSILPEGYSENFSENKNTKVELYKNNKLWKLFYISPFDSSGNKLIFKPLNKNKTLLLEIPNRKFNLYAFFTTNYTYWLNKLLINYYPFQIEKIKLEYSADTSSSFEIIIKNNQYIVSPIYQQKNTVNIDYKKVSLYFGFFCNIYVDKILECDKTVKDSIINSIPVYKMYIKPRQDIERQYNFYQIKEKKVNENGKIIDINPYYCYVNIKGDTTVFYIKYIEIDPIIKTLKYFNKE
jgi:hypothetical protein